MSTTLETAPTLHVEVGGIRFAYRKLGPESGIPLVFLQHFTGTMDAWDPRVVNALAADRPVIVFNNTGVGTSTGAVPGCATRTAISRAGDEGSGAGAGEAISDVRTEASGRGAAS